MELRKSNRKQARIRVALQGPSGSGKTYSALLMAYGLCKDWNKIAVIDTENSSADLYAHLGAYNVLELKAPFSPERYIEAIDKCENAGMDVIILDSLSHEWEAEGGILDIHGRMVGNSFTNWALVSPRHNALVQSMLKSGKHIIATLRSKQDYVLSEKNGKSVPEKVGMKSVTRDGMDYEFTIVMELDVNHNARCTKDRTQLFKAGTPFIIDESTGKKITDWCKENEGLLDEELIEMIRSCTTLEQLSKLYRDRPAIRRLKLEFNHRAAVIRGDAPEYVHLQKNGEASTELKQSL
jgi:hypothetical protein